MHLNGSKIFLLYFYEAYDVNLWEQKVPQNYVLFMQNKRLYRILLFYEKVIDTAED